VDFWKAFWKFLLAAFGVIGTLLAISQWIVKHRIDIPSWILFGLILLLFSITIFTAYWVSHSGGGGQDIWGGKTKYPKLKPSKETMFIMSLLAATGDLRIIRSELSVKYMEAFKGKTIKDFNLVMNQLDESGNVSSCGLHPGTECLITKDGLSYFNKHRKKFEPIGGPPTSGEKIAATVSTPR